jgi:flagellin-like hook-associated protein FlgL
VQGTYANGTAFNFDVIEEISIVRNRFNGESYQYDHVIVNKGTGTLDVGFNIGIDGQTGGANIDQNSVYINGDLTAAHTGGLWARSQLNGGPQIGFDPSGNANVQSNIDLFAGGDGPDFFIMKGFAPFSDELNPIVANSWSSFAVEWTKRTIAVGGSSGNLIFQYGVGDIGFNPAWTSQGSEFFVIHYGANTDQNFSINLPNMHTDNIGLAGNQTNIRTIADANASLSSFDNAINFVSTERARMGAIQNRLEHIIANNNMAEKNLQAAESLIRDTNMAKEMMAFLKNNLLIQANQAMQAQANQLPTGVLQLLK